MSTVIDELVTRYTLDPKGYVAGGAKVSAVTKGIDAEVDAATKRGAAFGQGIGVAFTAIAAAAVAAVGAVAALAKGTFDVGKSAIESAADFDMMAASFGGALGSMERGQEVMKALQKEAETSAFQLRDLTKASNTLVAGGLDLKTLLPVMQRFALIVGGLSPEGLNEVAGALLRIKGGSFGEAMEIFRRAGVGAEDFRKQGIQIDKGGQVNATPEAFMAALIKISEGRPKAMADKIAQSNSVKLSNFGDAVDKASVALGAALAGALLPVVEKVTKALSDFVENGGMKLVADAMLGFANSIVDINGLKFDDVLVSAAAGLMTLYDGATWAVAGLKAFADGIKMLLGPIVSKALGLAGGDDLARAFSNNKATVEMTLEAAKQKRAKEVAKATGSDALSTGDKKKDADPVVSPLNKIAFNTKRLVDQNDKIQRMVLGGGNAAAKGVTAVELSAHRKSRSGGKGHAEQLANIISAWIDEKAFDLQLAQARGTRY